MDELTRWEGQDPQLQPPGPSVRTPSSEEGSASWVDVRWDVSHSTQLSWAATLKCFEGPLQGCVSLSGRHAPCQPESSGHHPRDR